MQKRAILGFIIALVTITASCSMGKSKEAGEAAVTQFHNQFNAGQYKEIYDQADEAFRKAAAETEVLALFEAVRKKLGTIRQANANGWHVFMGEATTVTLQYDTEFTEGKATEQFVFVVSGDKAALVNYTINSLLLITK
jgi:hypothetical protein